MPEAIPEPIEDNNVGDILAGNTMQGNVNAEGGLVVPMRYKGPTSGLLMAVLMGQSGDASAVDGAPEEIEAGVVYKHYMHFAASNLGKMATLMIDKNLGTDLQWLYPSIKPSQAEINHNNSKVMGNFTNIAHSLDPNPTGGSTQMGNVSHTTTRDLAIFQQVTLRVAEITGTEDNLDSADEVLVTDLKVTVNRNISGEHESGSNAGYVGEPDLNGFPEVMMEFTVQDYIAGRVADLLRAAQTIQTCRQPKTFKAEIHWTGCDIVGSTGPVQFEMGFDLPAMNIVSGPANATAPGQKTPVTLGFKVITPSSDLLPDGTDWAWVTAGGSPFRFFVQNDRSAAIL
jgi:hypothetical protein